MWLQNQSNLHIKYSVPYQNICIIWNQLLSVSRLIPYFFVILRSFLNTRILKLLIYFSFKSSIRKGKSKQFEEDLYWYVEALRTQRCGVQYDWYYSKLGQCTFAHTYSYKVIFAWENLPNQVNKAFSFLIFWFSTQLCEAFLGKTSK